MQYLITLDDELTFMKPEHVAQDIRTVLRGAGYREVLKDCQPIPVQESDKMV